MVVGSIQATKDVSNNPFTAEALVLFLAIQFCKESSITHVIIEGDALEVVNQLMKDAMDWSQGGFLIQDARELLNYDLVCISC